MRLLSQLQHALFAVLSTFHLLLISMFRNEISSSLLHDNLCPTANDFKGIDGSPSDGFVTNRIPMGFLPSEGNSKSPRYTMAQINSALGAKSFYGWYAQIKSASFDSSQLRAIMDDNKASGAIFIASVMPSTNFNQVSPAVVDQLTAIMKKFANQGIEVWLRYAYEMNWYVQEKTYHSTGPDFITSLEEYLQCQLQG
ncbi:glycoside hydrolase family 26 protein [Zopfia rhizophila CBS 207.26]|uniref:Glycoside hydrolase family 26 protein n=1 Tax=Zopfia rhizophila CBS 207.26 TaxID=1314779 RepID=A0A6A6DRM5_9PEZI|nr:glycoside hydrolase family 26 protein [Zopfia rhizophila CBS 207.26]